MSSPALVARLCVALLCLSPLQMAFAAPTPGETDLIRERPIASFGVAFATGWIIAKLARSGK